MTMENRKTIQKHKDIRAPVAFLNKRPLVRHNKGVVIRVFIVHKVNNGRPFFPIFEIADRYPVLQVIHERLILLNQFPVIKVLELLKSVFDRFARQ